MPTFMIVRSRKKLFHESNDTDGENLGLRNSLYVIVCSVRSEEGQLRFLIRFRGSSVSGLHRNIQ